MSRKTAKLALLFTALADETRLTLLDRLMRGASLSIAQLTEGTGLTRQGITKHLSILEQAGIVSGKRNGREILFAARPQALRTGTDYLQRASHQWDEAAERLRSFVEA